MTSLNSRNQHDDQSLEGAMRLAERQNVNESEMSSQAEAFGRTVMAPEDRRSNTEDAENFFVKTFLLNFLKNSLAILLTQIITKKLDLLKTFF